MTMKNSQKNVFGVRVDAPSTEEVMQRVQEALSTNSVLSIATLNPEIMLHVRNDAQYAAIINAHSLTTVDGFGLQVCIGARHRVTGADLAHHVLRYAQEQQLSVGLLVRRDGLSTPGHIIDVVSHLYSGAQIQVFVETQMHELREFQPDVVLVSLGFPAQERWVVEEGVALLPQTVFLSVGGTFDYWTGVLPRAPQWMRRSGLEWLWRLGMQPRRIGRIVRAVIVFPLVWMWSRMRGQ